MPGVAGRAEQSWYAWPGRAADPAAGQPPDRARRSGPRCRAASRRLGRRLGEHLVERLGLDAVRGKPSRITPAAASGWRRRSSSSRTVIVVGHQLPCSMYWRASTPSGVPSRTAARNRSPVATIGMRPAARRGSGACVPLPAPGAPSRTTTFMSTSGAPRASFDEAFVVAHHQLRLELLHRLDHHRHHDQQRRAAQGEAPDCGWNESDESAAARRRCPGTGRPRG